LARPQDNLNVREKLRDPPHDYRASGGDEAELLMGVPQPYKPVTVLEITSVFINFFFNKNDSQKISDLGYFNKWLSKVENSSDGDFESGHDTTEFPRNEGECHPAGETQDGSRGARSNSNVAWYKALYAIV
jgi:hypothetical protein